MAIDPTLLRPFLGELDGARAHVESLRSAIDAVPAAGAEVDELLFAARLDADFTTGAIRSASTHAAPRDAAIGAVELAGQAGSRLGGALDELEQAIRAAGGQVDSPTVVARVEEVRRAADRLLRWDLDELGRTAREAADSGAGLGAADEYGRWMSFDDIAMRELGAAAGVVRDDANAVIRELDELGSGGDELGGASDDVLGALDDEIVIDEAVRRLDEVATPAHLETAANRAEPTLDARAANAMDQTAPEMHAAGTPALRQAPGGLVASGSDELLDAAPEDGDVFATMVLRGAGDEAAELPLIATGRSIRFPTRESALQALQTGNHGSWVISPERAGGWRAVHVESEAGDAADATLDAYRAGTLEPTEVRGEVSAIRGFVVEGASHGLRDDPVPRAIQEFSGFPAVTRTVFPGTDGFPVQSAPLLSVDLPTGVLRRSTTFQLATGPMIGQLVDGTRDAAMRAFRNEAGRGGETRTLVLMKLEPGRYAIVEAQGASAKQLQRSLADGYTPALLDDRIEAVAAGSNRVVTTLDLETGARFTT